VLFVLLLVDVVVVDDPADGAEEGLVLVVVVALLTFERLEDPETEGFIAGEPALAPVAASGAVPPRNPELDINAEAD
jgi:hypothetical protein